MVKPQQAFHDFEQAGWTQPALCQSYQEFFVSLTTQSVEGLLNAARVAGGSIVLDVACGTGYVAGAAAARGAQCSGLDFSPVMLELARQNYPGVIFQHGDATSLPFADVSFDAVVNNFGKPHFADPLAATKEAFRVLKAGGYYAFTVWAMPDRAVAFGVVYRAVLALGSTKVGLPSRPKAFVVSKPEHCLRCLALAGFTAAHVERIPLILRVSQPEHVFAGISSSTIWLAALLQAQPPAALAQIRQRIASEISCYAAHGQYEIPMLALLAYARKPE